MITKIGLFSVLALTLCSMSKADNTVLLSIHHSTNSVPGEQVQVKFLVSIVEGLTKEGWHVYFTSQIVQDALTHEKKRGWPDTYLEAVLKQGSLRPTGDTGSYPDPIWKDIRDNRACDFLDPAVTNLTNILTLDVTWQDTTAYMVSTFKGLSTSATPIQGTLPKVKATFANGGKTILSDEYAVTGSEVDARSRSQGSNDLGWAMVGVYRDHLIAQMRKDAVLPKKTVTEP